VLHLDLPPLRDRPSDIPILVRRFIEDFSREHDREFKGLSGEAMEILLEYSWPGNVRELRNLVESMVVLAPGAVIRADDIPPDIRYSSGRSMLPGSRVSTLPQVDVPEDGSEVSALQLPQIEFLFRTLVDMKIDLEDLRSEFDRFRTRYRQSGMEQASELGAEVQAIEVRGRDLVQPAGEEMPWSESPGTPDETTISVGPEMTMADIEREAIAMALRESDGNRRRAAERLGIGERTLYRKLKEFGIDA
jgi:DNA-binding NtrC family response regulator